MKKFLAWATSWDGSTGPTYIIEEAGHEEVANKVMSKLRHVPVPRAIHVVEIESVRTFETDLVLRENT